MQYLVYNYSYNHNKSNDLLGFYYPIFKHTVFILNTDS